MTRNITLRMDESVIQECKQVAVKEGKSLSQWAMDTITRALWDKGTYESRKEKALGRLEKGLNLGGKAFSRAEIYTT